MPTNFIDNVTLHLTAGDGGDGCVSVRREKFKPLAGPDGGSGGDGGSIILESDPDVTTLLGFHRRPHIKADNGTFGMGDYRSGIAGEDIVLRVPVGTVVRDADGNELLDMDEPGMRLVAAAGGRGGLGNSKLSNPKRKAPGFALLGTPGWHGDIVLELKTVADVALVGFPSAGKSSLVAALSAAKPKIADYPFTTLSPNLGVVQAGETRFTVADVPGLIPGASEGKGLGLEFLRHVERCSVLVHVIDCATLEADRDPLSDYEAIEAELAQYPVVEGTLPLVERPQLVALNKADVPEAEELAEFVRAEFEARGLRVFVISTATHKGLRELSYAMAEIVMAHREQVAAQRQERPRHVITALQEHNEPISVERVEYLGERAYRVHGSKPERWVAQTDFSNEEAVGYLGDRLAKAGVEDALAKAGAHAGDAVAIGAGDDPIVFDWEPTIQSIAEAVAPRGTDPRLLQTAYRPSRKEKRAEYYDRMDAKAVARDQLETERKAGLWHDTEQDDKQ